MDLKKGVLCAPLFCHEVCPVSNEAEAPKRVSVEMALVLTAYVLDKR